MTTSAIAFQVQSILIICVMIFGVMNRKNRVLHVKVMASSIIWDLVLILQIEISRSAIAKAAKILTNPIMLKIHLFFAVGSVVLYIVMVITGRRMLKNDPTIRTTHKRVGWTTLTFRIMTFITSWWAVAPKETL